MLMQFTNGRETYSADGLWRADGEIFVMEFKKLPGVDKFEVSQSWKIISISDRQVTLRQANTGMHRVMRSLLLQPRATMR